MWFDLHASLVFLLDDISESVFHQFGDMVSMTATFGGSNWVDERHLLETIVGWSNGHFPTFAAFFANALDLIAWKIFSTFQKEINVVFEALDGQAFAIQVHLDT